jgi:hypothetical protein
MMLGASPGSLAQCAMCRATLENNVSNGDVGIAAGINFGILYLFFTPYIAVAVIAYLWYRTSKNGRFRKFDQRPLEG